MAIRLSVVIVSYNMARELPRTIRSLSPAMQRGIAVEDYELIVVDNGSSPTPSEDDLRRTGAPVTLHRAPEPSPSPAGAVNHGLSLARGEVIGVFIDGARMASPGLLSTALLASRVCDRPVIGTLSFHLGTEVQMISTGRGYDQSKEDALLAGSRWEEDGYRLFSIAVPSGSSSRGWFVLPAETNALFLRRDHWRALGGYDPRFTSPGGGLVNLDTWSRACADPSGTAILLLGEATFHQVHGGVATNAPKGTWSAAFREEYVGIRGAPYRRPQQPPLLIGRLHPAALESLRASLPLPEKPAAGESGLRTALRGILAR